MRMTLTGKGRDRITRFVEEVSRFESVYAGSMAVLREARKYWHEVDLARGKGRLERAAVAGSTHNQLLLLRG
ncbi:hypothetical protein EV401DRAFT_1945142 [Pisolithus croceorrhizus]|nr:hypothetical protein EV401DRAFT_1945142 [Pisolithus croceorrhizus]